MAGDAALHQWVRAHKLTFEVVAHRGSQGDVEGADIVLFARHPELVAGDPGCGECQRIYATLGEIAARVTTSVEPAIRVGVSPFDAAFRLRPQADWAPEVALEIELTPRGGGAAAGDALRRGVHEVESGLQALGAQPGPWRSPG